MIDKHSETWREIAAWAESELSKASDQNNVMGTGPDETENLRGRIACLRELLGLADEPEQRVIEATEGYGFQGPEETG